MERDEMSPYYCTRCWFLPKLSITKCKQLDPAEHLHRRWWVEDVWKPRHRGEIVRQNKSNMHNGKVMLTVFFDSREVIYCRVKPPVGFYMDTSNSWPCTASFFVSDSRVSQSKTQEFYCTSIEAPTLPMWVFVIIGCSQSWKKPDLSRVNTLYKM